MTAEEKAAAVKEEFADLGVSVGYIGNVERWGDDRKWLVFTKAVRADGRRVSREIPGPDFDVGAVRAWLQGMRVLVAEKVLVVHGVEGRRVVSPNVVTHGEGTEMATKNEKKKEKKQTKERTVEAAAERAPVAAEPGAEREPVEAKGQGAPARVVLDVPFKEKDAAKAAGAKWDKDEKVWYAAPGKDGGVPAELAQWKASEERLQEMKEERANRGTRVTLDVPYADREAAKAAGAKWDPNAKSWYAERVEGKEEPAAIGRWKASPERLQELEAERREKAGRTLLDVPFKEKDEAKAVGAKWDGVHWFVPAGVELKGAEKWIPTAERLEEMHQEAREAKALSRPLKDLNERGIKPETHNLALFRESYARVGDGVKWHERTTSGGLWASGAPDKLRRIVVAERPLDAMAFHQMEPRDDTMYVAPRAGDGKVAASGLSFIKEKGLEAKALIVAAVSNTKEGAELKKQLQEFGVAHGLEVANRAPTQAKSWAETVVLKERDYIKKLGARTMERARELAP